MRLIWSYISIAILIIVVFASAEQAESSVIMANLNDMTMESANETLLKLGLVPNFSSEYSDSIGLKKVISQQYRPGEILPVGTEVAVKTSLGPYPINIEAPKENELTKSKVIVRGNVAPWLPNNQYIWIAVRPDSSFNHYWPQSGGPLTPDARDHSFEGVAFLGGNEGENFTIVVLLLNRTLNDAFSEWESSCSSRNNWPPITEEGPGYDRVSRNIIDMHVIDKRRVRLEN